MEAIAGLLDLVVDVFQIIAVLFLVYGAYLGAYLATRKIDEEIGDVPESPGPVCLRDEPNLQQRLGLHE